MKLLDFGLARAQSASDPATTYSGAGILAGTPAYMAPEQVRSEPVDARTDIFAAGILLFELVTGERPFRGATFVDVLQAVMTEHPPALSGSAALVAIDRVVQRALAKDPVDRFVSAGAMAIELRRIADLPRDPLPIQIKRLKRIAVLPFRLLRPDPEIDFFATAQLESETADGRLHFNSTGGPQPNVSDGQRTGDSLALALACRSQGSARAHRTARVRRAAPACTAAFDP